MHLKNTKKINEGIDEAWGKLRADIMETAGEVCGTREISTQPNRKAPWFMEAVEVVCKRKKVYLKNDNKKDLAKYKEIRANTKLRHIKEEYNEKYTNDKEYDLKIVPTKVWMMIPNRKMEIDERLNTKSISVEK